MNKILQTIIEQKHNEVRALRDMKGALAGAKRGGPRRPFAAALDRRPELAVIAEVKKASPSKGLIRADFDPLKISALYEGGGAAAVSVLTDEKFFQGSADYLVSVRGNVALPVLRKDFIIDILQVQQTAALNADAMSIEWTGAPRPRLLKTRMVSKEFSDDSQDFKTASFYTNIIYKRHKYKKINFQKTIDICVSLIVTYGVWWFC